MTQLPPRQVDVLSGFSPGLAMVAVDLWRPGGVSDLSFTPFFAPLSVVG